MVARYIIKAHTVERFFERVCGVQKRITQMTEEEVYAIKRAIRDDLSRARTLVGAERMMIVSRVQVGTHGKTRKHGGKFFGRADTDILRHDDRVYFIRSGTPLVVSMMRLNEAMMRTMAELSASDKPHTPPQNTDDVNSSPSDLRDIHIKAFVVLTRNVFSMMQTMLGWYHPRAIFELRKILSDPRTRLPPDIVAQISEACDHDMVPHARYVLHAEACVVIGAFRRPANPSDNVYHLKKVDEIVDLILLNPEQCAYILNRVPHAVYGCFDSAIECSECVFEYMGQEFGWSRVRTMRFLIDQFRDPDTHYIDLEDEPCTHFDLSIDGVLCYQTPAGYLWFDGARVVDCALNEEAQWLYTEDQRASL